MTAIRMKKFAGDRGLGSRTQGLSTHAKSDYLYYVIIIIIGLFLNFSLI